MDKGDAEEDRRALIQMYQAGFLDGWNMNKFRSVKFEDIKQKCKKSFELRFMDKLGKEVQKCQKKNKSKK